MTYFFDTYAIIEIIKNNENYTKFINEEIATSILNIGELHYALLRDYNKNIAEEWKNKLKESIISFDVNIIVRAMEFKFENKRRNFSFIDCVGYILAKENDLIFLTGDKEFEKMENVEFVK